MRKLLFTLGLLSLFCHRSESSEADSVAMMPAAFYEGEQLNYVIQPPSGFRMIVPEAINDGYSFAFIPDSTVYDSADIVIGVNFFKLQGITFDEALVNDTIALREHYGESLDLWQVDSITTGSPDLIKTFYINDTTRFIPNVMVSYLDGETEMLILELVISEHVLRVTAEEAFLACLQNTKAMPKGKLEER